MLSVTQIHRIEKLCGNTWDFQVFQDSDFLGATLEYLVDGIARHNFFEFSRDETVDLRTFAKAVSRRGEDYDAEEEARQRSCEKQDSEGTPHPSSAFLTTTSRFGSDLKALAAKLNRYANS